MGTCRPGRAGRRGGRRDRARGPGRPRSTGRRDAAVRHRSHRRQHPWGSPQRPSADGDGSAPSSSSPLDQHRRPMLVVDARRRARPPARRHHLRGRRDEVHLMPDAALHDFEACQGGRPDVRLARAHLEYPRRRRIVAARRCCDGTPISAACGRRSRPSLHTDPTPTARCDPCRDTKRHRTAAIVYTETKPPGRRKYATCRKWF